MAKRVLPNLDLNFLKKYIEEYTEIDNFLTNSKTISLTNLLNITDWFLKTLEMIIYMIKTKLYSISDKTNSYFDILMFNNNCYLKYIDINELYNISLLISKRKNYNSRCHKLTEMLLIKTCNYLSIIIYEIDNNQFIYDCLR